MQSYDVTMRTIFPVLGVLFVLQYEFAALGVWLFSGRMTQTAVDPDSDYAQAGYWSLNFDTFPRALFTLFACTINNWTTIISGP